jgi:hypothetical protein
MLETLQLEEVATIPLHDAPKLLVEWSSRWDEFVTSIGPAFARSGRRLAGEAPDTLMPYRGMLKSFSLQLLVLFVLIVLPHQIDRLRPYAAPRVQSYDVIYYSGDELPRTEDLGGAQSGATGRAGGREAHHATQTIRVARGGSLTQKVVDAPNLKLPPSSVDVANLLAMKANPGPAPAEGLHSSLTAPRLPANVIAPAQVNVTRDQSRGGVSLDAIVPPAPSISSDRSRSTPNLSAAVVPPAPNVQSEHTLYAPRLDSSIIAPAPSVSRERSQAVPSLNPNVVGPASTRISRDHARSTPSLNASVIPPAPAAPGREVAASRVRMNEMGVVPPPVSAPEREAGRNARLNLPAPSVIAPPPSADSTSDLHRLESGGSRVSSPNVIPPPPTSAGNTGLLSSIVGKLFGTQDVVPPPPTEGASTTGRSAQGVGSPSLGSNVVPPPPSVGGSARGSGTARGSASGSSHGASLETNVIPPPPTVTGAGHGSSAGSGNSGGSGNGTALADNVIPPPPSTDSGSGLSGSGRRGAGLGGPGDVGSVLAPPKGAAGNSDKGGVVISSQPGSKVGLPGSGGKGSLAMSPAGGDKPGLGGSGGGSSIGNGDGPGSGLTGEGSGAGKTGTGPGSDLNARGGISPTPGSGGAGSATTGAPMVPGVDVRGGSTTTVVTLPSFGSEGGSSPTLPRRSSVKQQEGPAITIVATSRSGGAFDFYGKLPGDNYTVYVDTSIGTVVMQFAEINPAAHSGGGAPVGPQGLRTDLPAGLPHARVVIKCKLDASGNLRNLQVLEPGPAAMTAKIMAALPSWKFRPAMRGAQPVEVNAILGFNIDTNDRN